MVGSAAIKQGRSANRKHTYFFFGLISRRQKLQLVGKELSSEMTEECLKTT